MTELLEAGHQRLHDARTFSTSRASTTSCERITGVKVRETLPDSVLEQADEVELVDIAPEELLERFREGKVYRPEQAERAAKHFFTKGNLIALRELALRTTAQRVDAQMQDFRRENVVRHAVAGDRSASSCASARVHCPAGSCAGAATGGGACGRR